MKTKIPLLVISLLLNSSWLFGTCQDPEIRGPLLLKCNGAVTNSHYYIINSSGNHNFNWAIIPSSAGTISNPSVNSVDVSWVGSSNMGVLVYTNFNSGGTLIHDTLKPQICCTMPVGATREIDDFDDLNKTDADVAAAFGGTVVGGVVEITGSLFIQGQLNLEHTYVYFHDCTFYMGAGAVIYGNDGINTTTPGIRTFKATFKGTCQMWQGFRNGNDTYFDFDQTEIDDAEYAINIKHCLLLLRLTNTNFYRNTICIYRGLDSDANPFKFTNGNGAPLPNSLIKSCTFDGTQPIVLGNFNGQSGIPINHKSFAGMYFNQLESASANILSIPFDNTPSHFNSFINLGYGIYAINSQIDVYNCHFQNIQSVQGHQPTAAIYSTVTNGFATRRLNVGDNDQTFSILHNEFTDCYMGVWTNGNVDSKILYNNFTHLDRGAATFISGTGVKLINANNCHLAINHNHFIDHKILTLQLSFASTAIFVSNSFQTHEYLDITENEIDNNRIGIYISNVRGDVYPNLDCHVYINTINSTIPFNLFNPEVHFGIWLSNVDKGAIESNWIIRSQALPTSSSFQSKMYGMNNVNCTNTIVANNYIQQYGTSMRYVSSCGGTQLHCNDMTNCIQGVSLANASMSNQGNANDSWDNTWNGFPTPTNSTYNRVNGTAPRFDWYNSGQSNSITYSNNFSPEPVNTNYIYPHPNQTGSVCNGSTGNQEQIQKLLDIISENITYPDYSDEEKYIDEEYVFQTLKQDQALAESMNEFIQYLAEQENSNKDLLYEVSKDINDGDLAEALAKLNIIIDENTIEHNLHFTEEIALRLLIDPNSEISESEHNELEEIAWTNAWQGGEGVFTARHLLEEEVFDVERNLRIKDNQNTKQQLLEISVSPNPITDKAIIYYNIEDGSNLKLIITNYSGKPVLTTNLKDNVVDVSKLSSGLYLFSFYYNGVYNSSAKITIFK